jgi:hypothetical protein
MQPDAPPPAVASDGPTLPPPAADGRGLQPLALGERPLPLHVAVAVAAILAVAVLVGVATVHDLSRHGGSLPGGLFIAAVLLALAWGMWRQRYWAVLSFEALLAFQIVVTSLALVVADTLLAAGVCALGIGLGGWLFWKLVRVMTRIQAGERASYDGPVRAPSTEREADRALR